MAKLYISEYERAHAAPSYPMPVAYEGLSVVDQTPVDFSGGAASSAAFAATTSMVRLQTDATCSIKFGVAPTATTSNKRMAANQTEYYFVRPSDKVSVIANN